MTQESTTGSGAGEQTTRAVVDRWPGLMRRTTAARYCELALAKFERAVVADD